MKLCVVVKYYPPLERVSGIIGFLAILNHRLGKQIQVDVVTHRSVSDEVRKTELETHTVHRVCGLFPAAAALKARSLEPDVVLFVSGINDLRLASAYVGLFMALRPRRATTMFYQATTTQKPPSRLFALVLSGCSKILSAGPSIHRDFGRRFGPRSELFAPGVEIPTDGPKFQRDRIRVGFINHLNRVKGADVAATVIQEIVDRHESVSAIIAGTGELSSKIESDFVESERVEVLGFLHDEERLATIADCDIMLLPFRTSVSVLGVSQTVLEVMAAGNVVIGTPTDVIASAIEHNLSGVVVPQEEFGEQLERLVNNPGEIVRLGTEARRASVEKWSIEQRVEQFLGLIEA